MRKLVREGFLQPVEDTPGNAAQPVLHSTRFVLVDGAGRIRGLYDAYDPQSLDESGRRRRPPAARRARRAVTLADLPTLNASLNATSAVLLVVGYLLIRARRIEAHRRVMITAFGCSVVFLVSYLVYHFQVGTVRFPGSGTARTVYLTILASHTVLAAAVPVLAVLTLSRALARRFDQHKRIARWTLPIWLYVSVTGVVVYWMLYRTTWG